jgi:hypothetical protein
MKIKLAETYNREEMINLVLQGPAGLHRAIATTVDARLEGRLLDRRRPSVRLNWAGAGVVIAITPRLNSSPTGWVLDERIPMKAWPESTDEHDSLVLQLRPDDTIVPRRWWKKPQLNQTVLNGVDAALHALARDVSKAFTGSLTCGWCGRKLTTPESQARGVGPECWAPYERMLTLLQRLQETH